MKLNSKRLRNIEPEEAVDLYKEIAKHDIYLILENVLDTYNIGGFFRLADAIGAKRVYLTGRSSTPPDAKIKKSSVGTYKFIPWEYRENSALAIEELREIKDMQIVAIEQTEKSQDYRDSNYQGPITFILGNETRGLDEDTEQLVDYAVEVPMYGLNKSLNVMVAAGIVVYYAIDKMDKMK
jgi:tRNA G18 (ribose-2'-O)-methylase SpoU